MGFTLGQFIFISGVLCVLCLLFLVAIVQSSFPRSIGGVHKWIWACGLCGFSSLVLSNQLTPPLAVTRIAGNVAFLTGLLLMYRSLHELGRFECRSRGLTALVVLAGPLFAYFTVIDDDNTARVLIVMSTNLILCAACAQTLQRFADRRWPEVYTQLMFILMGVISCARIVLVSLGLETTSFANTSLAHQKFNAAAYASLVVALMFGFMLLVSRRLRDTLIYLEAYNATDATQRAQQRELAAELEHAVAANELVLHFQPRVSLRNGGIVGVEALVRWNHPARGLIGPNTFIPLAERNLTILPLGRWVIERSVDTLNRLNVLAPGCRMAINVSTVQLKDECFVDDVRAALARARFPAGQLELEITESLFIDQPEKAAVTFAELKRLGVTLSVDDFGTGYSSLSYLKQFPLDCVKIDRSFIADLPAERDDVAITTAIIAMGHALGLKVVAEGVERPDQLGFLMDSRCDEYQGFLFSKPLPEADVMALLMPADGGMARSPLFPHQAPACQPT